MRADRAAGSGNDDAPGASWSDIAVGFVTDPGLLETLFWLFGAIAWAVHGLFVLGKAVLTVLILRH